MTKSLDLKAIKFKNNHKKEVGGERHMVKQVKGIRAHLS